MENKVFLYAFVVTFSLVFLQNCGTTIKEEKVLEKDLDIMITDFSLTFHSIQNQEDFNDFVAFIKVQYDYEKELNKNFEIIMSSDKVITLSEKSSKWYVSDIVISLDLKKANYPSICSNINGIKLYENYRNTINTQNQFGKELYKYIKKYFDTSTVSVLTNSMGIKPNQKEARSIVIYKYRKDSISIFCKKRLDSSKDSLVSSVKEKVKSYIDSQNKKYFDYALIPIEVIR
ncbi:hypothetical protein [Aquimarina sp. I32.4]|uniref:hypothetical protein n=1 Tax=Aquimarina sp. I32.4 TaxID=2053903 RepID=UPI000CDEAE62|nr:hypothetical protein [Aquimarina sp. I32.4]